VNQVRIITRIVVVSGLGGLLALALTLVAGPASATPQPLPFTYVYETLPKGSYEVEQYADFTPVKVTDSSNSGQTFFYGASQFQTEFEYGITDRLELGLYVTFEPQPPGNTLGATPVLTEGNGIKERLRLRLAEQGEWPLDVGLYGELVENDRELEFEGKIILQRRIGDFRVVANLWGEREYEQYSSHQGDWVINPTLGMTYQVTPMFQPGLEAWMRAEFPANGPSPRTFNEGPQAYVGPTMMFDFGNFWWSTGAYYRVTDIGKDPEPAYNVAPGNYGDIWIRMIIGLSYQ
jgi:hypothetical protein